MPRLTTSPSSPGSGEDDLESPIRLTSKRAEAAEEVDRMGTDEEPDPAGVRSDHVGGSSEGLDNDENPNEPTVAPKPMETGVKRKRGRPPKSATKRPASANSSKDLKAKAQRRSSRIVAKGKNKAKEEPVLDAAGRRQRVISLARERVGKKNAMARKEWDPYSNDTEWEVEEIVGVKFDHASSEMLYLVKWRHYARKENTWEPIECLGNCQKAIEKFEAKQKEALQKPLAKKHKSTKE